MSAIERRDGPSSLLLSRQNLPFQKRDAGQIANIQRGGYVLAATDKPKAVLIATGSEIALAMGARAELEKAGVAVSVVSMPCTSLFDAQDAAYRAAVLPAGVPRPPLADGTRTERSVLLGLSGMCRCIPLVLSPFRLPEI